MNALAELEKQADELEKRIKRLEGKKKGIKRVYIAGKLSGGDPNRTPSEVVCEYIQNLGNMCYWADEVWRIGLFPYIPGLDFLAGFYNADWVERDYRALSMAFLEVCDAVLVTSHSDGVQAEIKRAEELGIPVCYAIKELEMV